MSFSNEQIDNNKYGIKKGAYEKYIKIMSNRTDRRKNKIKLKHTDEFDTYKKYNGWAI